MNRTCPLRSQRRIRTVLLLGLASAGAVAAQATPWVGLSRWNARPFVEETVGVNFHFPFPGDQFGFALVAGDFNGDGAGDLATGIPGNDCGPNLALSDCGAVQVRLGFAELGGLPSGSGVFILSPETSGTPAASEAWDRFGHALATGDFNGDGFDDLAVGQPDIHPGTGPGSVEVHSGFSGGIELVADETLRPGAGGLPAVLDGSAQFGKALAVGNFNCDLYDDLAIGFPFDAIGTTSSSTPGGSVFVAHGGAGGLDQPFDGFRISQNEVDIPDTAEWGEELGTALAAGDFNGDGCDDLAIGVPREDDCGAVLILFGSPNSLIFANHYWLGEVDLVGACESGDEFARTLAAGDWNGDGFDDLAFGVPREDGNFGEIDMGMFGAIYGMPGSPHAGGGGVHTGSIQWYWEDRFAGDVENRDNDRFAAALASGDFDGDGIADLAIGTPGADLTGGGNGRVTVMTGTTAGGLAFGHVRRFHPGLHGIPAPALAQSEFQFGAALASGDFDGNGQDDLAVGMPRQDSVGLDDGGEVVLYGYLFRSGFEDSLFGEGLDSWTSVVP